MSREREEDDRAGGFLARWSRRKQDLAKPPPPSAAPAPLPQESAGRQPAGQESDEDAAAREAHLAELPDLTRIEAATDIRGFLDARVPEALRLAALRRAWASDPAVRDYLDPARDYALDYNTPGAAPGYGLISESQRADMGEFARASFSDAPAVPGQAPPSADAPRTPPDLAAMQQIPLATEEGAEQRPELNSSNMNVFEDLSGSAQPLSDSRVDAAMQKEGQDEEEFPSATVRKRQRGGGAMPV